MYISQRGLDLIKKYEGFIGQSYDDYNDKIINVGDNVRGTLTIGYGHVEGVYKGQTITEPEANELLKNDMRKYCSQVDQELNRINVPFTVDQGMYDALTSFCYNCGSGSLRTLLAGGSRDKQTVANMMLEYRNKGSVWEQGLLRRRREERELFLNGGNYEGGQRPQYTSYKNEKVAELQRILGVDDDGIYGNITDNALRNANFNANSSNNYHNEALTKWIQLRVGENPDGIYGCKTAQAVREFQAKEGLLVDGIAGYNTIKKLALV